MPKYMWQTTYTAEGIKGTLKEGAGKRVAYLRELFEKDGGTLEAMYWAFGDTDVYTIGEVPDNAAAAACSMASSMSGSGHCKTVVLLTAEEIDAAAKVEIGFRAPGA
jgi:uncharacterized protein with GYD domain